MKRFLNLLKLPALSFQPKQKQSRKGTGMFPSPFFFLFPSLTPPVRRCWHLRMQDREPEGYPAEASEREAGAAPECLGGGYTEQINKSFEGGANQWSQASHWRNLNPGKRKGWEEPWGLGLRLEVLAWSHGFLKTRTQTDVEVVTDVCTRMKAVAMGTVSGQIWCLHTWLHSKETEALEKWLIQDCGRESTKQDNLHHKVKKSKNDADMSENTEARVVESLLVAWFRFEHPRVSDYNPPNETMSLNKYK